MKTLDRPTTTAISTLALTLVVGVIAAACGAPAASPSPSGSPSPNPSASPAASPSPFPTGTPGTTPAPSGSVSVTSPAQAAALVFASDERFSRMMPLLPDMIGQSTWYEASEADDGYAVDITTGEGDCMAGCIDKHTWHYSVSRDGTVTLSGEEGADIDLQPADGGDAPANVNVILTASPTCPVEQVPPDPSCDLRAVADANIVLRDPTGAEIDRTTSDAEGRATFEAPAGAYYLEAESVEGLMAKPDPVAFAVVGGDAIGLQLSYDTGIR